MVAAAILIKLKKIDQNIDLSPNNSNNQLVISDSSKPIRQQTVGLYKTSRRTKKLNRDDQKLDFNFHSLHYTNTHSPLNAITITHSPQTL